MGLWGGGLGVLGALWGVFLGFLGRFWYDLWSKWRLSAIFKDFSSILGGFGKGFGTIFR